MYNLFKKTTYAVFLAAGISAAMFPNYCYAKKTKKEKQQEVIAQQETEKDKKKAKGGGTADKIAEDEKYIEDLTKNIVGGVARGLLGAARGVREAVKDETEQGRSLAKDYFTPKGVRTRKLKSGLENLSYSRSETGRVEDELNKALYGEAKKDKKEQSSAPVSKAKKSGSEKALEGLLQNMANQK